MKRIVISVVFCAGLVGSAKAQASIDALLLSQCYATGTARSVAMSGAFGALGGDLSVLSTNPAGLAVYRGSEFTFSPTLNVTGTNAFFNHTDFKEKNFRVNINNIGYVYTWNFFDQKGIQSVNIGLAYNRLSDFGADAYIDTPMGTSMLDEFVKRAYGVHPDNLDSWYERLAWDGYAINQDPDNSSLYYSDYDDFGYGERTVRSVGYRGGIGEYAISFGANINHKLYLGATWGIHDVMYGEYGTHEEYPHFKDPNTFTLDSYIFNDQFTINGWGMNAKFGIIYRPVNALRLGVAVHTPTCYWLKYEWTTDMTTYLNGIPDGESSNIFQSESPIAENAFRASTPWRYNAGAAVIIGNIGLVSLDAEYLDYSKNGLMPQKDYSGVNDDISNSFRNAVNLKAGAEVKAGPVSLRAGMAYYGTPYKNDLQMFNDEVKNKPTLSYSGGIGFRTRSFYMDAAYSYTQYPKYYHRLYETETLGLLVSPMQKIRNRVVLTFGFKF